jgi:CheY-like chemotaxis protein
VSSGRRPQASDVDTAATSCWWPSVVARKPFIGAGRQGVRHVSDAQPRARGVACVARGELGEIRLVQHPACLDEQGLTRLGERDAAVRAVEETDAELGFELADLLADGGLGDVQALGGVPEVQLLGDRDEVPQMAELHGWRLSFTGSDIGINRTVAPQRGRRHDHWQDTVVGFALPSGPRAPDTMTGMPCSVLVVDDDRAFRGLATRMLEAMGLQVVGEAGTVAAATVAAAELRPDAVLVDVGLPDGDGLALAQTLAALPWRPRIVLTSSDADAADEPAARRVGAIGFVAKADLPEGSLRRMLVGH